MGSGTHASVEEGTVIAGRYVVVEPLARGGLSQLYRVEHVHTGEVLAMKVLDHHLQLDPDALSRFKREIRTASRIKSDHVVRVTDADTAPELGGALFMVMELLKGSDLETHAERVGPLAPSALVAILGDVASALEQAHQIGIVHRDLKPANLFLHERPDGTTTAKGPRLRRLEIHIPERHDRRHLRHEHWRHPRNSALHGPRTSSRPTRRDCTRDRHLGTRPDRPPPPHRRALLGPPHDARADGEDRDRADHPPVPTLATVGEDEPRTRCLVPSFLRPRSLQAMVFRHRASPRPRGRARARKHAAPSRVAKPHAHRCCTGRRHRPRRIRDPAIAINEDARFRHADRDAISSPRAPRSARRRAATAVEQPEHGHDEGDHVTGVSTARTDCARIRERTYVTAHGFGDCLQRD